MLLKTNEQSSNKSRTYRYRPTSILCLFAVAIYLSLFVNYISTMALLGAPLSGVDLMTPVENMMAQRKRDQRELEKLGYATMKPSVSQDGGRVRYHGKVVDVLTVASKKRPEYAKTQRRTWAKHPLVRNFFNVTEDIDGDSSCQELPLHQVLKVPKWCRQRYLSIEPDGPKFSWLMQRFVHYYAGKEWLKRKPNPTGWLCAQKRFPIGLARTILGYAQRGEALPDFLLVVDDDTYYNMDEYYSSVVMQQASSDPFVGAGCRVTNGQSKEKGIVFPFGGFGLTFSSASMERLLKPLSRSNSMTNDEWQNSTLSAMDENLIVELDTFRDGMNLAETMEKFALAEPFQNLSSWTRGYCFHGHWVLAIFTQLYHLHSTEFMHPLQKSEITLKSSKRGPKYANLCKNEHQRCKATDLVCHYQTPDDMERLIDTAARRFDTGYELSNISFKLKNDTTKETSPMTILKSRFMQFQPNLLALGKARLQLFETFCLPTMLKQKDGDFLWLIRVDPDLAEELLLPLKALIQPYEDKIFLIASNDNTKGFREIDVDSTNIVSGDSGVLAQAVAESQTRWLVETRLDADDGLHLDMIGSLREHATEYIRSNNLTKAEWRAFCVSRSLSWHSGALSPVGDINPNITNTMNIPPEGIVTELKRHKSCITPGLSYALPPHVKTLPQIGHHVLHEKIPDCDSPVGVSGRACLAMLPLQFPQAVQARTPTSHGMGGFHREYEKSKHSKRLWKILDSSFGVSKDMAESIIKDFKDNIVEIAKDNLSGQCTEDHSCSHFARRYLERIIWNKEPETNKSNAIAFEGRP